MNVRAAIVLLVFAVVPLFAQTTPPATVIQTAPEGPRTYAPADFAQFAPRTALDMLNRVPGFSIRQEDQERGLGEATGNVVINGQRISGKSNDVVTELSRIPIGNVERIEIVDGSTLNIPGLSGQVANVIARSRGISGQYAYRPEFRSYYTDPLFTRFEVSVTGTKGVVQYTVGLDNGGSRSGAGGPTWLYDRNGGLLEDRDEEWRSNYDQPRLSGRLVLDGPGDSIGNLNLSYRRIFYDYLESGRRTRAGADRFRTVTSDEEGGVYEIGGDYELGLGIGRLKLIGLARGGDTPGSTTVITRFASGAQSVGNRVTEDDSDGERIGRAEYRWSRGGADWQVSAEGAFNSLDSTARLFEMQTDDTFTEIPLPGASARVQEDRYQVMGSYGRPLSPRLTMKLSAGGEYSQLAQVGGEGQTRTFYRPKGEFSAAWKPSARTDVNFKLARRVGQLDFGDFLASVNLRDDSETSANPNLVPEQSWDAEVETVRNLGEIGTAAVRVYARLIDDIIDTIPIGATGQAPGNLEEATVYGISTRGTLNLDRFGWRGARVDAVVELQDSSVADPLTGEERHISNSLLHGGGIELRHDVPGSDWAWGGAAESYYSARDYRLTEVGRQWEGPVWANLFLEHKNVFGLTVTATAHNLLSAQSMWDRTVYSGRRTTAPIEYVEERDRRIGPIFSFAIRGKF